MRTTAELREGFLSFFEEKGHVRRPSASVIPPADDPTTLFIVAGMQPMKRWFLGLDGPPRRVTTVQKVVRAGGKQNDLDDVGLTNRHLCFYEMLGNFSFGDYFKDGAVEYAWEFVTERMKLEPERLWATIFAGDPELGLGEDEVAAKAWATYLPRERILGLPRSENFWQAADTGPCGPCSELYYDRGEKYGCGRPDCAPGCECERYLEFWNLVFMEFELADDGTLTPLPQQNIDTGMGFERAAMLLQDADSFAEIDILQPLLDWIRERANADYGASDEVTKAYRVVVEHARTAAFLVAEGVAPSNEGRGYVLRRVIRRAVQFGRRIGLEPPFLYELADVVRVQMGSVYPELEERRSEVADLIRAEEERFRETLARGEKLFEEMVAKGEITPEDAFRLHDTYGFPWELTKELAAERGLEVNEEEFTRLMEEQRERSRQGSAFDVDVKISGSAPRTQFVGYERTDVLTAILAYADLGDGTFQAKLEQSPFYPEGGGQVSDAGYIENEETGVRADLIKATRLDDDQVLTFSGEGFGEGMRVRAVVPWSVRFPTMANHTATHLLHKALRDLLGEHVKQAGSAVRPDKLRFDFTHPQALTTEERERVEHAINEIVFQNRPVRTFVTPIEEARNLGAMMLFGEKYGEEVRVVEIDGYSRELCGGTHVRSTAEIGPFVILSEGSVGSGARRIEAVTSGEAFALLHERSREAEQLRAELVETRKQAKGQTAKAERTEVAPRSEEEIGGVNVYVGRMSDVTMDVLLAESDRIKQERQPAAVVLGGSEDGRVHLVANFDRSLEGKVDAVEVIKAAAAEVGGGGGGRATMARAGGKDPAKLDAALERAEEALRAALA
ncbi:MAG: alanine--tRNA ligase [Actinobacteria bacterium 13_2_20CM_68_14]|nr:MAG: alanine--tRNA ligase [Actinobacteria bacterium 13_2_20CM_68_14]